MRAERAKRKKERDEVKLRRRIWLALWFLSLAGISFYGGSVSYGFFFALLLIPAVSYLYLLCVFFRFKIFQEAESKDMVCGQPMPYRFVLQNEDYFGYAGVRIRMFPWFTCAGDPAGGSLTENTEYELLPGDRFSYETTITCRYCGRYEVGVREIVVTDFFKLFRLRYPVRETIKATVRPRLVQPERLGGLEQIVMSIPRETLVDRSEPDAVVRDYVSGDSFRSIHWKATARMRQLMVRERVGEEKQSAVILFDARRYSRKMEEYIPMESKRLETLLAVSLFFVKRGMPIEVYCGREEKHRSRIADIGEFEGFYARICDLYFDMKESFPHTFRELYDRGILLRAKVVISVVQEMNEELAQLTEELAGRGIYVVLYAVTGKNMDDYIRQNTERRKVIAVPEEAELEGVL